ncbi:hypothetical protein [Paenibacillus tuaregi]|uniref:hypothetical protein n=1 Tax=Paenibacillus tuaregi TaxID=1816681 RepID=UPI000838F0CE|nr:hypothetical protein [Paenibacillus tuaregi]
MSLFDLPQAFGCGISEDGVIIVDEFGKTHISEIYNAGDAASRLHQAITVLRQARLLLWSSTITEYRELGEKK